MFKSHFLSDKEKESFYKIYFNKLTKLKTLPKKLNYTSKLKTKMNTKTTLVNMGFNLFYASAL